MNHHGPIEQDFNTTSNSTRTEIRLRIRGDIEVTVALTYSDGAYSQNEAKKEAIRRAINLLNGLDIP